MVLQAREATYGQARAAEARDAGPASGLRLLPSIGASVLPAADPAPPLASGVAGPELPFVGRGGAFERLVAAYERARAGQAQVVVIEGEAGSGKTRLAEEFLRWAAAHGADVLRGAAIEPRGWPPYQVVVDALRPRLARERTPEDLLADVWLAELVRLFPELRERYPDLPPAALSTDDGTGQGRLHEAVAQLTRALAERARPGALVTVVDDAQWADPATRDLLRHLLRRHADERSPHLLVVAVRSEAPAATPGVAGWLAALTRLAPTTRLALEPLAPAETERALAAVLGGAAASGEEWLRLLDWLHAQAAGQPFYLVELLRALVDRGELAPRDAVAASPGYALAAGEPGAAWPQDLAPGGVRDLIRGQLAGLSRAALDLATAAAVLGGAAGFERLCAVAGVPEREGLAALDELLGRQLLREADGRETPASGGAAYRFGRELVRAVVYAEAGEARRRIFHRRALAVLADEPGESTGGHP